MRSATTYDLPVQIALSSPWQSAIPRSVLHGKEAPGADRCAVLVDHAQFMTYGCAVTIAASDVHDGARVSAGGLFGLALCFSWPPYLPRRRTEVA